MSTPRVPPVPPNKGGELDKTAPSTKHRKVEKVEKIDKVAEVDDESRARQFRQFVEAEDEKPSSLPTPFSLFSVASETQPTPALGSSAGAADTLGSSDSGMENAAETAIPSPTYSPPPSAVLSDTASETEETATPLPQSSQFWTNVDNSTDEAPMQPQMEENPSSTQRTYLNKDQPDSQKGKTAASSTGKAGGMKQKGRDAVAERGKMGQGSQGSLFGPPGKPTLGDSKETPKNGSKETPGRIGTKGETSIFSEETAQNSGKNSEKNRKAGPDGVIVPKAEGGAKYISSLSRDQERSQQYTGSLPQDEKSMPQIGRGLTPEEEERKPLSSSTPSRQTAEMREEGKMMGKTEETMKPIYDKEAPSFSDKESGGGKGKKKPDKDAPVQVDSPTVVQLPDAVIPAAAAAASAAAPYLGPEALSIYFHMIGTITSMVSPRGDSRTEFVLNAPSFANSRFYGSTISIQRFSSAPYQLNITLTGSSDAVQQFNQSIPNLLAAFKSGNFAYTINRIEAVYEKPLFKRKEGAGEKGDRGFGGDTDNRKR